MLAGRQPPQGGEIRRGAGNGADRCVITCASYLTFLVAGCRAIALTMPQAPGRSKTGSMPRCPVERARLRQRSNTRQLVCYTSRNNIISAGAMGSHLALAFT